jgi:hypothetical protein
MSKAEAILVIIVWVIGGACAGSLLVCFTWWMCRMMLGFK